MPSKLAFENLSHAIDSGDGVRLGSAMECLEDEILSSRVFPDAALDVVERALHSPKTLSTPGIEDFFITLYTVRDKMSGEQLGRLIHSIALSFGKGMNSRVSLVLADFIARSADPKDAIKIFGDVLEKSLSENELHGISAAIETVRHYQNKIGLSTTEAALLLSRSKRNPS